MIVVSLSASDMDRTDHRLIAGREDQRFLEAEPVGQPLFELDMQGRGRLNTRRAQPARRTDLPLPWAASLTFGWLVRPR